MKVKVTTTYNSSADLMWNELQNITTLQKITFPVLIFRPQKGTSFPKKWLSEKTYPLRLYFLGLIPLGHHTIEFETIDSQRRTIISNEHGRITNEWKHRITIENLENNKIQYTDEVEIEAGLLTFPVWIFANLFYRYRQWRWRGVLARLED